jgi:hypothetical protein
MVARTADQVVIGAVSNAEIEAPNEYASAFTVSVERVLVGPRQAVIEVRDLVTNPACGTTLMARDGDRIALAIGGTDFGHAKRVSAIAYLAGIPHRPDIESMTVADVYVAAGIPDTAALPAARPVGVAVWLVVAAAIGGCVLALWDRRGSRPSA